METAFENDKFVFLMADFANFSYVNSRYGYNEGNELLKSFASALSYFWYRKVIPSLPQGTVMVSPADNSSSSRSQNSRTFA